MKKYALLMVFGVLVFAGCNKEEPQETSADFTTSIENGTLEEGEGFTVYLDNVTGEFLTYFSGNKQSTIYDPEEPRREGTAIDTEADSIDIRGYRITADTLVFDGEELINDTIDGVVHKDFVFTMVAASSGNWSEDYVQDVKSMRITVTRELEE